MDPTANGDQGILGGGGVEITFTQAAGIRNPNQAKTTYTLSVRTTSDSAFVASSAYTITTFVNFVPASAPEAALITVTGGGFEKNCVICPIRLSPQNVVAPTTGIIIGNGLIDANGVFRGFFTTTSGTAAGGYVWVADATGTFQVSSTKFKQTTRPTPTRTPTPAPAAPPSSVSGTTSFTPADYGSSAGSIALLAGGVAAIVAIIAAGGWFTRRRWLGRGS